MEHGLSRRGFIKQAAAGIAAGAALPVAAQAQGPAGTSLYARLGGYDALAATATFDKFTVPERERAEVLALLASRKGDIVEKA